MNESRNMKAGERVPYQPFDVITRLFPFEFEAKKKVAFYPELSEKSGHILEIGPGRGDLLLTLAEKSPQKKFVAIELGAKRFHKLIPRIQKKELANILLVKGDARTVLPHFFSNQSFETIFVLFPDPWPKKRHAFRRLLTTEFSNLLSNFLKPGGHLIIGTDVQGYAAWVQDNLESVPQLQNALTPLPFADHLPDLPITYFEEKWRKAGKEIYFFKYWKK